MTMPTPSTPTPATPPATAFARHERAVRTAQAVVLVLTVLLGVFTSPRAHLAPDLSAYHHAPEEA
jgi:hypothetical protein